MRELTLLGFDSREMWSDFSQAWPIERKREFLLRTDIEKPLSVDTMVWPSILFDAEHAHIPSYHDGFGLVLKLSDLYDYLGAHEHGLSRPHLPIAILVSLFELPDIERNLWNNLLIPTTPCALDRRWTLLGYDVTDIGLVSGLMNCSYYPEEQERLGVQFGPHLNRYHLFNEYDHAHRFRQVSNARVIEHAPFFVTALYQATPALNSLS